MIYNLFEANRELVFNRRTWDYEWVEPKGTIKMAHEGRYITLRKEEDEKREFRYDLSTGHFERITHYKTKDDKIKRCKVEGLAQWFSRCSLITEDEKFARLFSFAKSTSGRRYKSNARFIERFATNKMITIEQWLSLGVILDRVEDDFTRICNLDQTFHAPYNDDPEVYHKPNEFNKDVLNYILEKNEEKGHISFKFINDCYDFWNDNQYNVLQRVEEKIAENPQYQEVFLVPRYEWRETSDYVDALHASNKQSLRNLILQVINKYNLDLDAFLDYCLYLAHVESIDIQKLMADYPDYLRREFYLKNERMSKMNKYPETWLTTTHKQQKEFENLQRLKELEEGGDTSRFDNSIENNKHLEWSKDDYFIRMPLNAEDIRDEANQMEHCLATYIPKIEAGQKIVMFMRDKNHPEQSLVTVEVIDNAITQAYAKNDTHPSIPCQIWLTKWARKKNLRITAITLR